MRLFGLIGQSLGHSVSARYFTDKFQTEGLTDCDYRNFELSSIEDFPKLLEDQPHLAGLNVTVPYKEKVIPYLDKIDPVAGKVGAVNTIAIDKKPGQVKTTGFNTDVIGFKKSLLTEKPLAEKALVLGTGGASKAIAFVLNELNIMHQFVSRTPGKNELGYQNIPEDLFRKPLLIVNTTPLGTFPDIHNKPDIPYELLNGSHFLFDLVYNPKKTTFLQEGEKRGAKIKNGLEMLQLQAEASWNTWNR